MEIVLIGSRANECDVVHLLHFAVVMSADFIHNFRTNVSRYEKGFVRTVKVSVCGSFGEIFL